MIRLAKCNDLSAWLSLTVIEPADLGVHGRTCSIVLLMLLFSKCDGASGIASFPVQQVKIKDFHRKKRPQFKLIG